MGKGTEVSDGGAARAALVDFRAAFYGCLTGWTDALFELTDAALCVPAAVGSVPALSLEPVFRRGHGSLYKALARGRIDPERLRRTLVAHRPPTWPAVFAVDASAWPRSDAETSPERGFYYSASQHSARQPIVAGWAYQWIAQLNWAPDSWTAPLDARRIAPSEDATTATIAQVQRLVERLDLDGPLPLFVLDAGYDPIALTVGLAGARAQLVVRIRSDRVFHPDPTPRPAGAVGRPRRHGERFACADPAGRRAPDAALSTHDPRYGAVRVEAWHRPADRARQRAARRGRAPPEAHGPCPQDAVAVVGGARHPRPQPLLARVPAALRPRAHVPVREGHPRLDHPGAAHARPGRPLDLARPCRLHPAPARPGARRRPPPALGTPTRASPAYPVAGPPGVSPPPPRHRDPGQSTKIPPGRPRTPQGHPPPPTNPLSGCYEGRLTRFNRKLRMTPGWERGFPQASTCPIAHDLGGPVQGWSSAAYLPRACRNKSVTSRLCASVA